MEEENIEKIIEKIENEKFKNSSKNHCYKS